MLLEGGIVIAKRRRQLELGVADLLDRQGEPPAALSARVQLMIDDMRLKWAELDRRIAALTAESVIKGHGPTRPLAVSPRPEFRDLERDRACAGKGHAGFG